MDKSLLASKIEAAKRDVTDAEAEIEKLLGELRVMVRAEKVGVSEAVEGAFVKLRSARAALEGLEEILVDDQDGP